MSSELIAMAKEQGRLAGLVEGVRDDVSEIKVEQSKMKDCLTEQCGQVKEIKVQLGHIIKTMTDSGARPVVSLPESQSVILTILKHPATPLAFALVVVLVIVLILTSALTGRTASDLADPRSRPIEQPKP